MSRKLMLKRNPDGRLSVYTDDDQEIDGVVTVVPDDKIDGSNSGRENGLLCHVSAYMHIDTTPIDEG